MNSVLFGALFVVCGTAAEAQNPTPSGVSDPGRQSTTGATRADTAVRPLRVHVVRGAEIGGITGLVGGALIAMAAASQTGRCYTAPSLDFGGCSDGITRRKTAQIVAGGAIVGTFVGAVLGYTYHTNLEDQRRAHCRLVPEECK